MARKIRRSARRHRALAMLSALAIVAGTTLAMAAAVGAEETTDTAATTTDSGTTTEEVATDSGTTTEEVAPEEVAPEETAPAAEQAPVDESSSTDPATVDTKLRAENHTTFPEFESCVGGTNTWESDSRADPGGICTDGNPSQQNQQLPTCITFFGSGVTNFYDSVNDTGTGNSDVTGAITAHPGGGTQLNVTPAAGVVIDGVLVKAGNGFNAYIGDESDMIGPLVGNWDPVDDNPSPNYANISHYIVCYHFSEVVETGGLTVDKNVVGTAPGGTKFTVNVNCDGSGPDGDLVFDEDGDLIPGESDFATLPITGIALGTICTITEPDDGGAVGDPVIVGSPATIAVGTKLVTVTNTFTEVGGDITVTLNVDKVLVGSVKPTPGTEFTVHVSCTGDATVEEDLTFTYPNGLGVQAISKVIPSLGSLVCTVTETGAGVVLQGYKIDGGAIQSDAPTITLDIGDPTASVTVVNDPTTEIEVEGESTLASTGSSTNTLLGVAALLLVLGTVAWLISRQRRTETLSG